MNEKIKNLEKILEGYISHDKIVEKREYIIGTHKNCMEHLEYDYERSLTIDLAINGYYLP